MGFLGFGKSDKATEQNQTVQQQPPQQPQRLTLAQKLQLPWSYQEHVRHWQQDPYFRTEKGHIYDHKCKRQIDGSLLDTLGTADLDDLLEMEAPMTHREIYSIGFIIRQLAEYVYNNLGNNNSIQQLKGQYDEIKKRCEHQEKMIEKLMKQNQELQNKLISMGIPATQITNEAKHEPPKVLYYRPIDKPKRPKVNGTEAKSSNQDINKPTPTKIR